jgi:putative ABC transport system substrate-binding protein
MKRREFITLLGGGAAAGWAFAPRAALASEASGQRGDSKVRAPSARAEQQTIPVIGFLSSSTPDGFADNLRGFHQGLKDGGYVEGENVAIVYRWAENRSDRLPELATDLVRRQVAVIATAGHDAAFAAKAATSVIPTLFIAGLDPVELGLVASVARPGSNATGVNFLFSEVVTKRLELLRELVPGATRIAVLVSSTNAATTAATLRDVEAAARSMGLQIQVLKADTGREIDVALATFLRERPDALFVSAGPFFTDRRVQLVQLAARYIVPATYSSRQFAEVGGLMSYGASLLDAFRQVGIYAARILKGAKPADLPVVQSAKLELVINAQTARMLGLDVPPTLLARADEVIE